jgi:hypothetical protein
MKPLKDKIKEEITIRLIIIRITTTAHFFLENMTLLHKVMGKILFKFSIIGLEKAPLPFVTKSPDKTTLKIAQKFSTINCPWQDTAATLTNKINNPLKKIKIKIRE